MQYYVLFSPIGGHDPMGNFSDGPMLRVCRVYKPKKVYLFFSKEMWEHHQQDNRYLYCLQQLCDELQISIEHELIFDETLTEVHLFDAFQKTFSEQLIRLHRDNPDSRLLVNISSGSPAMKSCLLFLSKMLPFEVTAVQVATPHRAQNPGEEDPTKIDIETMWSLNQDQGQVLSPADGYSVTRCREEQYTNTLAQITKEAICRQIDSYDYEAAIREAATIPEFMTENAMKLLHGAAERIRLNSDELLRLLPPEKKKEIFPVQQGNIRPLFEYLCWLQMKLDRDDVADFVRGITPALYNVTLKYLEHRVKINLKDYTDNSGKLRRDKLKQSLKGAEILSHLDTRYGLFEDGRFINSDLCIYLISVYESDAKVNQSLSDLRAFESGIRNQIAHDIVKINIAQMERDAHMKLSDVMSSLRFIASRMFGISPADWDCFSRMNELLKTEVKTIAIQTIKKN